MSKMKVNEQHILGAHPKPNAEELLKTIAADKDSCFNAARLFKYEGWVFEELTSGNHEYRIALSSDDYDYVEDEDLMEELGIRVEAIRSINQSE